ncbi:MAG: hypothetical protein AAF485_14160 [Chloroflexota bacterium]
MMRKRSRFLRVILIIALILLIVIVTPLVGVVAECRVFANGSPSQPDVHPARPAEAQQVIEGLTGYQRNEDQTYLTLPEWYIVYSSDEYAAFIQDNPPSQFPYFRAIQQYWVSYYDVCAVTRDQYAFNTGYHFTLVVIGVSFTIENGVKGIYENSIGWLTELLSSDALTEEDRYAAQVAEEYGKFIHTIPWFEFPFREKMAGVWQETSLWGPNPIRKWERKIALTLEYGLKSLYGQLIGQGSSATYGAQALELQVWATGFTDEIVEAETQVQIIEPIDDEAVIANVPRYQAFTDLVPTLTKQGVQFVEIAGNDEILITVIAPSDWQYNLEAGEPVVFLPILTEPAQTRVAINVPVESLHLVLEALPNQGIEFEHIYDY